MTSISHEYCAFTVAIVIECHPKSNGIRQWSIESLDEEMKSEDHNFTVNPLALHQGLNIFNNPIESLGHTVVKKSAGKNEMRTEMFMDLVPKARGSEIIFAAEQSNTHRSRDDLVSDIAKTANHLIRKVFNVESRFVSISEVCGVLWLAQLNESVTSKRRKRGDTIGDKQLGRYAVKVRDYIADNICAKDESPSIFINAARKQSATRSAASLQDVRRNMFGEMDEDAETLIISHPLVTECLQDFPRKNIKFNTHEKDLVISLFDAITKVRIELEGEDYFVDHSMTASITKRSLQKSAHYSELVVTSIMRWSCNRNDVAKESGRKISVEFEADVWGKLMICEFERKNVSSI